MYAKILFLHHQLKLFMKSLFFVFAFAGLIICTNSFAQQITRKNLLGIWSNGDQSKRNFSIEFIDALHLIIRDSTYGTSNGTYQFENRFGKKLLVITLNKEGINHYDHYVLTFINADTLKFENTDTNDPIGKKLPLPSNFFLMKKRL